MRYLHIVLLVSTLPGLGACWLPVATGSAQSGRTVGKSGVRVSAYGEAPTPNFLVEEEQTDTVSEQGYPLAPVPVFGIQVGYGVTDYLDIEASAEGVLWFGVPLFYGGSLGLRGQLVRTGGHALALAGSVGGVGFGIETDSDEAPFALTGRGALNYEFSRGGFALRSGIQYTIASVKDWEGEKFTVHAPSLTVGIGYVGKYFEVLPYVTVTHIRSPRTDDPQNVVTGGLMLGVHWGRGHQNAPAQPLPPPPPTSGIY